MIVKMHQEVFKINYIEIDNWDEIDLNELEINQQIGGGGYAIVHEGKYKGKPVAVKLIFDPHVFLLFLVNRCLKKLKRNFQMNYM